MVDILSFGHKLQLIGSAFGGAGRGSWSATMFRWVIHVKGACIIMTFTKISQKRLAL